MGVFSRNYGTRVERYGLEMHTTYVINLALRPILQSTPACGQGQKFNLTFMRYLNVLYSKWLAQACIHTHVQCSPSNVRLGQACLNNSSISVAYNQNQSVSQSVMEMLEN